MDVPVFPAPPALDEAGEKLEKVAGVGIAKTISGKTGGSERKARRASSPVTTRRTDCRTDDEERQSRRQRRRKRSDRMARFVNSVHPRITRETGRKRARVTELRLRMTERREDAEDDADVVCASSVTPVSFVEEPSSCPRGAAAARREESPATKTVGVQTNRAIGPYRLKVLPSLRDILPAEDSTSGSNAEKPSRFFWHLRFLGRICLCQFGLAWLLTLWTLAGAASFYAVEGPREREQVLRLKDTQRDLAVGLATELRQLRATEEEMEPLWSNKVRQYVAKHEKVLLAAVDSGYGEGGNDGRLWTFSGCLLFAVSLVTTLGFGAPVPRTTSGRTVAVVFAAVGIPAHFLLILNLGLLLAVRLQRYAAKRSRQPKNETDSPPEVSPMPKWVKLVPFCCIGAYYVAGILCFGVARSRPFAASLLFPLDFTAAGGLATISGPVRVMYGIFLEGAVAIAAFAVAVVRVSATQSLTNIGLKYGLLIEA